MGRVKKFLFLPLRKRERALSLRSNSDHITFRLKSMAREDMEYLGHFVFSFSFFLFGHTCNGQTDRVAKGQA